MAEVTRENFPHKNPEFLKPKERLSDEQIGNLLSAIGNNEAKAITLILMRNGGVFDSGTLDKAMLNAQEESKGWIMAKKIPFNYCFYSLAPIGLVVKETLNEDLSTYGYSITEDGKKLGVPLAGLLLDFSKRHNIPLSSLFGTTSSASKTYEVEAKEANEKFEFKKRSPSTTLKILYELLTSELPIREVDIEIRIGEHHLPSNHLARLSKLGLIQYDATERNKPFSSFRLATVIPKEKLPKYKEPTIIKLVFDIFQNHSNQYLTIQDIYNLLPKEQKENRQSRSIYNSVSKVLFFLAKNKYLNIKKFHKGKQSDININDEQRTILTELLEIMYGVQNQEKEVLDRGRKLAEEIVLNPNRVSNLLRRSKEASSRANQSSPEETQGKILAIVQANLTGITSKEIQKVLEKQYGKILSTARINKLSAILVANSTIRVEKEGNVNRFYSN